jgi:NAD-dependent deacetylase
MNSPAMERSVSLAAELIRSAQRGVVLTGAGISTASGIPDFRSEDSGLWTRFDPMEVASLSSFRVAPERFFSWVRPLADQLLKARPNPAHQALVRLERAGHLQTIITQNIDGLHQRAGSTDVIELHGSFNTLTCVSCYRHVGSAAVLDAFLDRGEIPRCPDCGHILKPDVILFEEQLSVQIWQKAEQAIQGCDLLLVAGSSLEVVPVAKLPWVAADRGAPVILVNKTETYIDRRAKVKIYGELEQVLPRIALEVIGAE